MKLPAGHSPNSGASLDETLRLIAHAPVPGGLEERVHEGLRAAQRNARVSRWSSPVWPSTWVEGGWAAGWARAVAAAAIVTVVAGGGWGVYMRVQHQPGKTMAPVVVPAPASTGAPAGFSSAGAMRTPQTVKGPALVQPGKTKKKTGPRRRVAKPAAGAVQPAPAR